MNNFVELIPVIVLVLWAVFFLSREFRKTISTFTSKEKKDCSACGCEPLRDRPRSGDSRAT